MTNADRSPLVIETVLQDGYPGPTAVRIEEGCNCLILVGRRGDSYGNIDGSAIYAALVDAGKLSDFRPWLASFKNWDDTGERRDLAEAWWARVRHEYADPEFWRREAVKWRAMARAVPPPATAETDPSKFPPWLRHMAGRCCGSKHGLTCHPTTEACREVDCVGRHCEGCPDCIELQGGEKR